MIKSLIKFVNCLGLKEAGHSVSTAGNFRQAVRKTEFNKVTDRPNNDSA